MDNDRLYDLIDDEEDMSDQEKREAYFDAIAEEESEHEWENSF